MKQILNFQKKHMKKLHNMEIFNKQDLTVSQMAILDETPQYAISFASNPTQCEFYEIDLE